jgi:2-polyprenyl-6-hydroxyphenyl methylase/3-demethylubiquinone-9 3-methyltransferase
MSRVHDWIDWLGGLPFEVAAADEIFRFYKKRGFTLQNLLLGHGHGNNEFVFQRTHVYGQ